MNKHFYSAKVREVGITNRSVSGVMPDIGAYESSLERDFMELSRFDGSIEELIPQPLIVGYVDQCGVDRTYTPDGLAFYKSHLNLPPLLYEIKYREDFKSTRVKLLPKLKAAKRIADARGWVFKVFTEREIRIPYLDNVKFLWPYRDRPIEQAMTEHVLSVMSDLEEADPQLLLLALCSDERNRAFMIPIVWHLIANFRIGCDLDEPLTMQSALWAVEGV